MQLLMPELASNQVVSLTELLTNREKRQFRQKTWLACYAVPLISLTIIAPGMVKDTPLTRQLFLLAWKNVQHLFQQRAWQPLEQEFFIRPTGIEGIIALPQPANLIKQAMLELEINHPVGRLWDIDVIDTDGSILSRTQEGLAPRCCLICEQDARVCGRNQTHSLPELLLAMQALFDDTTST